MKLSPEQAMQMAITQAYKGATHVSPNPLVGSVVLDADGNLISSGHHEFYGGPHAEVNAVKGLTSEQLQGATVYVTLEPCAHEGKTPSCAKMLAKLPLRKVVYGLEDPNPLVAGQGAQILRDAGIDVENFSQTYPQMKADLEEVCEAFLWNFRKGKIFVSLKVAQSLDGQIALNNGQSQWITNETSRVFAHYLRACHDATLVGRGTVEHDNPSLNIRHPEIKKENKVVVIDPEGKLLPRISNLKITDLHNREQLFWCVSDDFKHSLQNPSVQILTIRKNPEGSLDLSDLLENLWRQGLRSIMIEGGAETASQFLKQNLVNRLYIFQAPLILGAGGAKSWTQNFAIHDMKERLQLSSIKFRNFDNDLLITGRLK